MANGDINVAAKTILAEVPVITGLASGRQARRVRYDGYWRCPGKLPRLLQATGQSLIANGGSRQ